MSDNEFKLMENAIIIFPNKKKSKPGHPDYKGKINVNGVVRDLALWRKSGASGDFLSGVNTEEWVPEGGTSPSRSSSSAPADDDFPF